MRYAQALVDWADAGGYDARDALGRLHGGGARRALRPGAVAQGQHPLGRGAEAAGARGAAARAGGGAAARRAGQLPRRARPSGGWRSSSSSRPRRCCSSATTASCSTGSATRIATLEPGAAGSTLWVHPGRFSTYHQARADRNARLEELRRRWDEEHAKLKALVQMYKAEGGLQLRHGGSRYQAAQTRLAKFEEAGPPEAPPAAAERPDAADRRPHRQACRRRGGARAHRPDEAVRPRGLVRRAGRGPRQQRLGQVALPAAAWPAAAPTPSRAPAGGRRAAGPGGPRGPAAARLAGAARLVRPDPRAPDPDGPHAARDPAPRGRAPDGHAPRGGGPGAGPLRPGQGERADVRLALGGPAGALPDPAARAVGATCCCSTSRPTTSTCTRPRRSRRGSTPSRAPSWRSPTTAGSPGASTASWSSAPTAGSTRRTSRSGTRGGSSAPADGLLGQDTAKSCRNCEREAPRRGAGPLG